MRHTHRRRAKANSNFEPTTNWRFQSSSFHFNTNTRTPSAMLLNNSFEYIARAHTQHQPDEETSKKISRQIKPKNNNNNKISTMKREKKQNGLVFGKRPFLLIHQLKKPWWLKTLTLFKILFFVIDYNTLSASLYSNGTRKSQNNQRAYKEKREWRKRK